jgi:phage gpG-like protein
MNLKDLDKRMNEVQVAVEQSINTDLPRIVGVEAVNHFKEGFENEGFTDTTLVKWQDVKRRMAGSKARGADTTRKILTGRTGNLKDSITFDAEPRRTIVYANPQNKGAEHNYAVAHNFGTSTAGRGHNVTIPARQFLAKSAALESNIYRKMASWIHNKIKLIMQ